MSVIESELEEDADADGVALADGLVLELLERRAERVRAPVLLQVPVADALVLAVRVPDAVRTPDEDPKEVLDSRAVEVAVADVLAVSDSDELLCVFYVCFLVLVAD